ncbi:glycosyltransferase family 4 protein [Histidinibacterium lentulum]|uniref:Glycosyltransferase family 1 protein n=1 Tax=Histidinibacterium lentulum TaxID=2480588 RepID=A0A3N2QV39_9RHOB|nr:glycosyltransferase family 4 protein [Histidinibacterium lentulum]ROT99091.1 glycosyltransferase family 1 protein [Histidinibacterium lentulum]
MKEMALPAATLDPAARPTYRVAFVNTHPIQYFAPLYAYMTRSCGIETTGLYLSDFSLKGGRDPGFGRAVTWDVDLLDGYEARFMGGDKASKRRIGGFFSMVAPQLWGEIRRGRFDAVIIHGHNLAAHHVAWAACVASGTPAFARGDTNPRIGRRGWKAALRRPLMRQHYRGMAGVMAVGTANAAYYRSMGVPESRIFLTPYAVDNDRFAAAAEVGRARRTETRAALGMDPDLPAILFAAKFIARKRPDDLLAAFARLRVQGVAAQLVMVGTGERETALKARVVAEAIPNVVFAGFVNQTDLPAVYAASDLFVLPSVNEPWGLSVNEAMCAGLPVVASAGIGCADDLVQDGVNGATFTAGDVAGLADALRPILTDAERRAAYGSASLDRIGHWSYADCAAGIRAAIEAERARRGAGGTGTS